MQYTVIWRPRLRTRKSFNDSQVSSPKQIANYFNRQLTSSKLDRHTSSRETQLVSRGMKRKSLTSAVTFTTYQVTKGISICSNTRTFGSDRHVQHLPSKASWIQSDLIPHCSFQRLRHIFSDSIDLEVSQRKLWRISYSSPSRTTCFHLRPTRFPTQTLYHFCIATTDIATGLNQR